MIARAVAKSRIGRILFALVIAALSCGLAYLCWQARDLIAVVLAAIVILTGLQLAWKLLPLSEQTRSRWARRAELGKRFPSYRWRKALLVGLALLIGPLWEAYRRQHLDPWQFVLPAAFLFIGIISTAIWHICHRDVQNP